MTSKDSRSPSVSIIVPTRNGGVRWEETLRSLLRQNYDGPMELLVIDSSSNDGTPSLTEQLCANPMINTAGVTLYLEVIPESTFGHGKTRNAAALRASGALIMFLSQDATPGTADWVTTLTQSLQDPSIVGTFCRQLPRPTATPVERFNLSQAFPPESRVLDVMSVGAIVPLFSNVANVIRRDTLVQYPFREDILMSEDQFWAVDVLREGGKLLYVADTFVLHSHDYGLVTWFRRYFDAGVSSPRDVQVSGEKGYVDYLTREARFVVHDSGPFALPGMVVFECARVLGYMLGKRARRLPLWLCRYLSGSPHWFEQSDSPHVLTHDTAPSDAR